jgi:hypothetical protein
VCALYLEGKHTIEMSVMVHYVQSKMNHLGGHKQKNTGVNYVDGVSVTQIRPDMNPVEKNVGNSRRVGKFESKPDLTVGCLDVQMSS